MHAVDIESRLPSLALIHKQHTPQWHHPPSPSTHGPRHRRSKASPGPMTSPKRRRPSKPSHRASVCRVFRSSPSMTSTAHGCCRTCKSCWYWSSPRRTWTDLVPIIQRAGAFRVFARKGYTEGMSGHISVRDPYVFTKLTWVFPTNV
jgi:hypothetical protein